MPQLILSFSISMVQKLLLITN